MLLISAGLIAGNSAPVAGIPSLIYIGPGVPRLERPRTLKVASFPFVAAMGLAISVIAAETVRKAFSNEGTDRNANRLVVTAATEPVKFTFFWVPKATTTTPAITWLDE